MELLRTRLFAVERVSYPDNQGRQFTREIIRHPGSVVVIPVLPDGKVCLIQNFRISVGEPLMELPAGTLEPPEPPLQCAHRELREETGYRAAKMELITSFYPAPGILDERMHLYLATGLSAGEPAREAGEQIENIVLAHPAALAMVRRGEIKDGKTIVGLLMYELVSGPGLAR
jgi:ADP-ribose pyrophosphatase